MKKNWVSIKKTKFYDPKATEKKARVFKIAYMCGVDYQHELASDQPGMVPIYTTVKSLKRERTCWRGCGIVQVEISIAKWTTKQNLKKNATK